MPLNLWRDSWIGRITRRLGRIGVAAVAAASGLAVFALVLAATTDFTDRRRLPVYIAGALGLGVALGLFAAFDRLGLLPDDSDHTTGLDLRDR
jgi:hypothetical protein